VASSELNEGWGSSGGCIILVCPPLKTRSLQPLQLSAEDRLTPYLQALAFIQTAHPSSSSSGEGPTKHLPYFPSTFKYPMSNGPLNVYSLLVPHLARSFRFSGTGLLPSAHFPLQLDCYIDRGGGVTTSK